MNGFYVRGANLRTDWRSRRYEGGSILIGRFVIGPHVERMNFVGTLAITALLGWLWSSCSFPQSTAVAAGKGRPSTSCANLIIASDPEEYVRKYSIDSRVESDSAERQDTFNII